MTLTTQISDPQLRKAMTRVSVTLGISLQNALRAVRLHGGGGARDWEAAADRAIRLYRGPASLPVKDPEPEPEPAPQSVVVRDKCAKCRKPFAEDGKHYESSARHGTSPFCGACVDRCHSTEIADHWCAVDAWREQFWKEQRNG